MRKEFIPVVNQLYVYNSYSLLFIKSGSGIFEVDFKQYSFESNKIVFLSPRQYFRMLSGDFVFVQYEFANENIEGEKKSRFLFKHLVSLCHINLDCKKPFHLKQFNRLSLDETSVNLLHNAIEDWVILNPFQATQDEVDLLFDVKEIIDNRYNEPVELEYVSTQLKEKPWKVQRLVKDKLHNTVTALAQKKKLLEAERKIAFTDLSVKEIAYELGFNNSDYFFKFFKQHTNQTPSSFKELFSFSSNDNFIKDVTDLIEQNFKEPFKMAFYAGELAMSEKTLSRKIAEKLGTSFLGLLHNRRLKEAKILLNGGMSVTDTAFELGFKETSHFSAFFKKYTGNPPVNFLATA